MKLHPGFVRCRVERHITMWIVFLTDWRWRSNDGKKSGRELLQLVLHTDYDQAAFARMCGVIEAPGDWDGIPSKLPDPEAFYNLDPTTIRQCPDDYLSVAELRD